MEHDTPRGGGSSTAESPIPAAGDAAAAPLHAKIDPDALYRVRDVAALVGADERTIRRWREQRGGFPRPVYFGRPPTGPRRLHRKRPRWTGRALLTWLANRQEEAQA